MTLFNDKATGSDVTSLNVSLDSAHPVHLLTARLAPETDGVSLYMRVSTDGGLNYKNGASDYFYENYDENSAANAVSSELLLGRSLHDNTVSVHGAMLTMRILAASEAGLPTAFQWMIDYSLDSSSFTRRGLGGGIYQTAEAINAVQIFYSTDNVADGMARTDGLETS